MKMIPITDQISVSAISLGATGMGPQEKALSRFAIMDRYVELGGNCFDTARLYSAGQSDAVLGQWLRASGLRDKVILCTKGCHPVPGIMHVSRLSEAEIVADIDDNLKTIGVEYADLFLLHRDNPRLPVSDIMPVLDRQVKAGKVRAIGASNWTVGRINEANQFAAAHGLTPFSVSQLHFSLAVTTAQQTRDITHVPMNNIEFDWYKETQLAVMAFATQARGYFARIAQGLELKAESVQYYGYLPVNARRAERAIQLAKKMGVSLASLLAAYARDSGLNATALVGVSSMAQLEEVMEADGFTLTPAQVAYLETGREA